MEELNILQAIISGGPGLILGVGIVAVWRAWRSDVKEKDREVAAAQQSVREAQEKRVTEAQSWSQKYNDLATKVHDSLSTSERFMEMVERNLARGD